MSSFRLKEEFQIARKEMWLPITENNLSRRHSYFFSCNLQRSTIPVFLRPLIEREKALGTRLKLSRIKARLLWYEKKINMADTRTRGPSPPRGVRNRSRERDRAKERETNDQKPSIDREKVKF